MMITNTSEDIREISVSLKFGYLTYDSLGNPVTKYDDTNAEINYSLLPYLKVFPSKLIIPPKEKQTIRFMVTNASGLEDKTYWTRIIVTSAPIAKQIDTNTVPGKVAAQIIIKTEMIGLIAFIKGKTTSQIDIGFLSSDVDTSNVNLLLRHEKNGNSPFWGTLKLEVLDLKDESIIKKEEPIAIYFACNKKYTINKAKLTTGKYKAKVEINNIREEVPEDLRMAFKPIEKTFEFTVP